MHGIYYCNKTLQNLDGKTHPSQARHYRAPETASPVGSMPSGNSSNATRRGAAPERRAQLAPSIEAAAPEAPPDRTSHGGSLPRPEAELAPPTMEAVGRLKAHAQEADLAGNRPPRDAASGRVPPAAVPARRREGRGGRSTLGTPSWHHRTSRSSSPRPSDAAAQVQAVGNGGERVCTTQVGSAA
jgi:hypothetical protein